MNWLTPQEHIRNSFEPHRDRARTFVRAFSLLSAHYCQQSSIKFDASRLHNTCHSPLSGKLGNRIDIPQIKSGSVDILSKKWKWPDHAELLKTDDLFKYGCRCRIFHCANKWNRQNRALVFILWINFQIHTGYESEGCLDNLEIIYVAIRPWCAIYWNHKYLLFFHVEKLFAAIEKSWINPVMAQFFRNF